MSQSLDKNRYLIRTKTDKEIGLVPVLALSVKLTDHGETCTISIDNSDYTHFIDGLKSVEIIHEGQTVAEWKAPAAKTEAPQPDHEQMLQRLKAEIDGSVKQEVITALRQAINPGGLLHSFMRNR